MKEEMICIPWYLVTNVSSDGIQEKPSSFTQIQFMGLIILQGQQTFVPV